jgi:leucyl-tRNA---protein transferase
MSIEGVLAQPTIDRCPYLPGLVSLNENMLVKKLDDIDAETFLSMGFRHFGEIFFRPICDHCCSCIPIRVPVRKFTPSKSVRRLFNRAKHLTITLEHPVPHEEMFELYKQHKNRFKLQSPSAESYEMYLQSFFHAFSFNRMLTIRDGQKLVAVSHLDVTANAMSAVYCYFDETYARFSPGKLAIYKEIVFAKEMGIKWLYLGFYIERNRHTNYKILFHPNQVMVEENLWIDHIDNEGNMINPLPRPHFHHLAEYHFS